MAPKTASRGMIALGMAVAIAGLALLAGGLWLAALGGSIYYLMAGAALLGSGTLIALGRGTGAKGYALFLTVTIAWAVAESGFAPWPLMAWLLAPALLGLLFVIPGARASLGQGASLAAGVGALALLLVVGAHLARDSHDIRTAEAIAASAPIPADAAGDEWTSWGGDKGGSRFSRLAQITPANVGKLEAAWTFHTRIPSDPATGYLSATPLMVGGRMFLCGQDNSVFALDPDSGRELWRFDPRVSAKGSSAVRTCRGVAFARTEGAGRCAARIVTATFDGRLIALDATDGKRCEGFGTNGAVKLFDGMGLVQPGFYYSSAPPAIARDRIVVAGWVADNQSNDEPSGVIRTYDVHTGALVWAWDAGNPLNVHGPRPGEHYSRSTPNTWAPMSVDDTLGLIYAPTGNPTPDHYGALRSAASEKYGSSVVALDIATGAVRWSFQTAHHDLWDYDVPAQPSLFAAGNTPAIAIPTKRGETFVLDRRTGKPLLPVTERAVPSRGAVEKVAATQPFSAFHSMAGPDLAERDMWGLTPFDQLWCRVRYRQLRYDGKATPPGTDEALIYPSIGGGMNFGGVAIDPVRRIAVANALYYGTIIQLVPRAETDRLIAGAAAGSHAVTNFGLPLPQAGTPFGVRLKPLASPLGVPCNAPPFGRIAAIHLDTGKVAWERPFGTARDAGPLGLALGLPIPMGAPNFGGSLTTASGLTFIGAAREQTLRAFDTATGKELWSARLPASAQTMPMTYRSPRTGCQYVATAAGGHNMLQSPLSDSVVAFRLPGCSASKSKGDGK
ncbi:Quinoprotein glucose dehydrogenase [Novosphingobium resinovorum]|uniref:Quinoprotein glucose dehydrogenase n=1 Tax=Novosphingobium resinovorum TaxID=158500 RepID=A0A031JIV3_9SPHN|nr:membrane-bound PQQ-dependent dehydrogenase, glucose/quinate/shikimate family [Novosphingobium resinovorum]EZP73162.1 Quinoprotein glucose dehydrogenase [Novosphingobium resinovorum]